MKYYLAGPMSGLPECNFPAFERAARELRLWGFEIASPHDIDHGETPETQGQLSYSIYMKAGIKLLMECDGIIMIDGWTHSRGAMAEFNIAVACGMEPMYYDLQAGALTQL